MRAEQGTRRISVARERAWEECATGGQKRSAAQGDERAALAAQQAISSPLLDNASIAGAQGVLVNITGGENITLHEIDEATSIILEEAGESANIIVGAVIDKNMTDDIQVTVISTGFNTIDNEISSCLLYTSPSPRD